MKKGSFIDLLIEQDEETLDHFLHQNGKNKKPTNPLYQQEQIKVRKRRTKE